MLDAPELQLGKVSMGPWSIFLESFVVIFHTIHRPALCGGPSDVFANPILRLLIQFS